MYNSILREHKAKQQQLRQQNAVCRAALFSNVEAVTADLLHELSNGIGAVYVNQKKIEHEAYQLQQQTALLTKQLDQWVNLYNQINTSIKEFGDLQNWSRVIEADMVSIATSLSTTIAIKQQEKQQQQQAAQQRLANVAASATAAVQDPTHTQPNLI